MAPKGKKSSLGWLWATLGLGGLAAIVVVVTQLAHSGGGSPPPPQRDIMPIRALPPPTPPPTLPPTPPPQMTEVKQQMLDQTPVAEPVAKPVAAPEPASSSLGTNIQGNGGPDGFGLGHSGNGFVGGGGGGGGGGDPYGWYGQQIKNAMVEALGRDDATRYASFASTGVLVHVDSRGNIRRVKLLRSTGDPAIDKAITLALSHLKASEPPPNGKPVQYTINISERRPD